MEKDRNEGQISIYLSIIFMSILVLTAVLTDAARISAGEAEVKKAVRSAARSALAEFSTKLKEDYGIFALSPDRSSEAGATIREYIGKNLVVRDADHSLDLNDYRIEELYVTPVFELTDEKVFKGQILEYMKFRAPKDFAGGFLERLDLFRQSGKMAEVYRKKVAIDKLAGRMDKGQQKLKKSIDGSGTEGGRYINGFNKDGCVTDAFKKYSGLCSRFNELMNELEGLNSSINSLPDMNTPGIKGKSKELETLLARKDEVAAAQASMKSEMSAILSSIKNDLIDPYISLNENAIESTYNIVNSGEAVISAISELEKFLESSFGLSNPALEAFIRTVGEDVGRLKGLVLEGRKAADILGRFRRNLDAVQELSREVQNAGNLLENGSPADLTGTVLRVTDLISSYDSSIIYEYQKPQKGDAGADPRPGKVEAVKRFLTENVLKDRNYLSAGIRPEELPSTRRMSGETGQGQGGKGAAGIAGDEDLFDEEGSLQENTFSTIGDLGKMLAGDLKDLRDEIYINEYIMNTFRCAVSGNGTIPETLKGEESVEPSGKEPFYNCEVEYILQGNASENTNKALVSGQLLLVRFGLDTLHVYTDGKKRTLAASTAAAVAGWWTGGAGIPVISNLIICGWGMGEALTDVSDLLAGKKVPVFKTAGDWKLDIGIKAEGAKTKEAFCFSYQDYLRVFLLAMNSHDKLGRIEDLIQINLGTVNPKYRVEDCKTCIRVEALISMKYLFATRAFVPENVQTRDGRYKFKVVVYEGY